MVILPKLKRIYISNIMNFLKYFVGGVLVVLLRGIYDVFLGGQLVLNQSNLTTYGVTVLIGFLAFACADQIFKNR